MSHDPRFPAGVEFYPCHPSDEKTERIKTVPSPLLEGQTAPFDAKELCTAFERDLEGCLKLYEDKRFQIAGVASAVELDIHGLPTVQLSDMVGGRCYAHCIFPEEIAEEVMGRVKVGDRVTILSNYLVMSNAYGIVMKCSELIG